MPSKMFNVKAKPLSVEELKCKCKWIVDNWDYFIIVTESLKNRKTVKKIIEGVEQCHTTFDADYSLNRNKNIVVTYNNFTHIAYKCLYLGVDKYQVIFLDSDEIQYPHTANCDDFQIAVDKLYVCDKNGMINWIADDYSGEYTGMRILCENHLLKTSGCKVLSIASKSINYPIKEARKFYRTLDKY